jgi:hypothetical protein
VLSVRPSKSARRFIATGLVLLACLAVPISRQNAAYAAAYTSPEAIEQDFKRGLGALAAGDTASAIRIFRAILAVHPALPRVRLELARAYFQAREWERSRREFFSVLSGDIPDPVKASILAFLRAIDARRGFDWDLAVSFASAPQARRNYDTDKVKINFFGTPLPFEIERDDSGSYGVAATGSAEYRLGIPGLSSSDMRIVGFGQGFFNLFEGNGSGADDYLAGGAIGARAVWPQTTLSAAAAVSTRYFGGDHFEDRVELRTGAEWRDRSGLALFVTGTVGTVNDHLSNLRDGTSARLRTGLAQSVGGRASVGLAFSAERRDADAGFESYTTLGPEVFGTADLGAGIDVTGRVFVLNQDHDQRNPLFFEKLDDWEYGFDLEFTKTDFFMFDQFSPFARVGFSRRESSIDAFSYNEYRFNIGFKKAF